MAIPKNKKRISITIPKNWNRLILKAKAYALGESMTNSFLFCYLILEHLYTNGYISGNQYNEEFNKYFLENGNK